jgi:hypothetical protein
LGSDEVAKDLYSSKDEEVEVAASSTGVVDAPEITEV